MADGYIALDGERGQGEGGGVHCKELAENHERTAQAAPNPQIAQNVIGKHLKELENVLRSFLKNIFQWKHLLGHWADEGDEIGKGEWDEIAVGGGVQGLRAPHCHHHHQVARHSHQENARLTQETSERDRLMMILQTWNRVPMRPYSEL